ncbi:MAG: NADH-quinone oxidoreductase subunit C [Ancalomicrobiaceae bacterium]|nr:NADH-quinone oxidoreductase subunit C [Ancalomicrobiaceae bacterium]
MTTRLPTDIEARLAAAAPGGIEFSSEKNTFGVTIAWCGLAQAADLAGVAKLLVDVGARLSMISGLQPPAPPEAEEEEEEDEAEESDDAVKAEPEEKPAPTTFGGTALDGTTYEINYHFDVGGDTLTVVAYAPHEGSVPSLTPYFRPASWPEREIMEMYAVTFDGHPDPRRLFIDQSIDKAVLERLIPYSTLVNAASTKDLWDRVLAGKGGNS